MKPSQQKLNVTAIVHGDTGVITAFVTKLPGLLVQGNSHDDVAAKIDKVVQVFIKALDQSRNNLEIETKVIA